MSSGEDDSGRFLQLRKLYFLIQKNPQYFSEALAGQLEAALDRFRSYQRDESDSSSEGEFSDGETNFRQEQMDTEHSAISESNSDNNVEPNIENDGNDDEIMVAEEDTDSDSDTNAEPNIERYNKIVYEDAELTVSYSRIAFRKLTTFALTDYHFNLKIDIKNKGENLLVVSALNGILEGMRANFEDLKEEYDGNLDREIYITMCHDDLNPGIRIGPSNFFRESVAEIVLKCQEKIDRVLESHASLSANKSLNFYIIVYGN